jgi:phosphatidate cytidylyltransferase
LLVKRIVTALILGSAVTVAILFLPTLVAAATLGLLFVAGAWEWADLGRLGMPARIAYVAAFVIVMLAAPWWVFSREAIAVLLIVALLWWLIALLAVLTYPRNLPLPAVTLAGLTALLPAWAALTHLHGAAEHGAGLTMTVLAIVWSADTGAYFTGRSIGRTKLAPNVSPGKTWEGVAGGVVVAGLVSILAAYLLSVPVGPLLIVGAVTALVSVLGDLTVSIGKRNVGLKDSGKLLPGHGGMLDRIDSLTAAAPAFVLGLLAAGLVD